MAALIVVALAVGFGLPVRAQEASATTSSGWSFALTPYVWFVSLKGDVGVVPALPPASVDAAFGDIIEQTNFAFLLAAEARRGRFGVVVDVNYLALSADGDTPGPLFGDAETDVTNVLATIAGAYRVLDVQRVALDLLVGARAWYVDTELDLSPGLLPGRTGQRDKFWADPVVGLRWNTQLGRGFFLAGNADIGGFGVASDLTWQLLGTLGYRFNDRFSARAGYRHLKVDYDDDGFVWDVDLTGPIVGATFRF